MVGLLAVQLIYIITKTCNYNNQISMQNIVQVNHRKTSSQKLIGERKQGSLKRSKEMTTLFPKYKQYYYSPFTSKAKKCQKSIDSKQKDKEKEQNQNKMANRLNRTKTEINMIKKGQISDFLEAVPQVSPLIKINKQKDANKTQTTIHIKTKISEPINKQTTKINNYVGPTIPIKRPTLPKPVVSPVITKPAVNPLKNKRHVVDREVQDFILKNIDVSFKDIVGLDQAKAILQEAVIRPRKRPDLYTGIRAPPRALLLYGPPGNGKTYLCKALARECGCTFIALSASSIMNKLVGQSEKMVKKIFFEAQKLAPSIIFIDQIDSMLTARTEKEHELSRRLKTEFFVQLDGIKSHGNGQILLIGATNLPKQLDDAAKRRFNKFVYIGPPQQKARQQMLLRYLKGVQFDLSLQDINIIVERLQLFSASEIHNIVAEASMFPMRQVTISKLQRVSSKQIRKINMKDFMNVIEERKPIVSKEQLEKYKEKI